MRSFLEYLTELKVYRGVQGKYSPAYVQDIVWVSTDPKYAAEYAPLSGEMVTFNISQKLNAIDLGFRRAETHVPFDEIRSRLVSAIMDQFSKKALSEAQARKLVDELDKIKYSGLLKVYEWVHKKNILALIKKMGYNAIIQREMDKGAMTYGILDKKLLTRIK